VVSLVSGHLAGKDRLELSGLYREAYFVENLEGYSLSKVLNGKYLKRYYPSTW
jgi:hypothetical protein